MQSIRQIYKTGYGPSSSHTMAPRRAAEQFRVRHKECTHFRVQLFGSLAATGKGHLTDIAIAKALAPAQCEIVWKPDQVLPFHPNGMIFEATGEGGGISESYTVFSTGGGNLSDDPDDSRMQIYEHNTMREILEFMAQNGLTFWEYIEACEGRDIWAFLKGIWQEMTACTERGLSTDGVLPGALHLPRKAMSYYTRSNGFSGSLRRKSRVFSYSLAASEENASGGRVVTAPTCGSCGVLPSVLYLINKDYEIAETQILKALATAGLVGNLIRTNASISGAEVGCQGEVGSACSMASAAATQLFGGTPAQIEYAAEIGLEHHLGLTCDPVCGLVQIPCIERNAFAAERALDASAFALLSDGRHLVSFDKVVETMMLTGHDLPSLYRETSEGGLAKTMIEGKKKEDEICP